MFKKHPRRKTTGFIDRTLLGVVSLIKESLSNDEVASRNGFLQKRDPRFKCLSVVLLMMCVLFTESRAGAGVMYLVAVILAMASAIRLDSFLQRTLLFVPLFSFFIVVPAVFNVITPGEPVVAFKLGTLDLSITRQGIDSAVIFFLRVLASVSLALVLVLTTRHHVLLKVLRIFRVPRLFVMTMGMTYRYIYLFLDIVQNTFTAVKSRVGYVSSTRTGRRIVTANMAGLWLKSYRMQTEVYSAMLSRGYTGEPQVLDEFRLRAIDILLLLCAAAALIGTLWMNRSIH